MRPDLDDVQYLSSKADKEKLRCLDAVTNLAKLILASSFFVYLTVNVKKIVSGLKVFLFMLWNTTKNISFC